MYVVMMLYIFHFQKMFTHGVSALNLYSLRLTFLVGEFNTKMHIEQNANAIINNVFLRSR